MDIGQRLAKAREVLGVIGTAPKTRCSTGKNMYSQRQIEIAIKKYAKRRSLHGEKLHSYHCKECDFWHLTRQK